MEKRDAFCWLLDYFVSSNVAFNSTAKESGLMFCEGCQKDKSYSFITDKNGNIVPGSFQVDCPKRNA